VRQEAHPRSYRRLGFGLLKMTTGSLPFVLVLGLVYGLPLHVRWIVGAPTRQGNHMIDHVSRAGTGRFTCGRAGMIPDELSPGGSRPADSSGGGAPVLVEGRAVVSLFAAGLASIGYRRESQDKEKNQATGHAEMICRAGDLL